MDTGFRRYDESRKKPWGDGMVAISYAVDERKLMDTSWWKVNALLTGNPKATPRSNIENPKSANAVDSRYDSDYLEWILSEGELRSWLTMIAV
jgi:hypothetical protein